jgi:hypothetical protein
MVLVLPLANLENEEMKSFVNTIVPWPVPVRQILLNLQRRRAFTMAFTSEE